MSEENRSQQGEIVRISPEGEITPVPQEETFDQILRARGATPNREVRATYDTATQEGKEMMLRHIQADTPSGTKDSWLNREFNLVGATSWPVTTNKSPDGKELLQPRKLIRTVLETEDGDLIPSASAYVYESLQMIQSIYGPVSRSNPIRVRIGKAGQADKLIAIAAVGPANRVADKSKGTKPSK